MNGVSQQAPEARHPTQVEEMVNCTVSFVDGTRRRPPLEFIKTLPDLDGKKPYFYSYERGDGEEAYIVAIIDGAWIVYNLEGAKVDSGTDPYLNIPSGHIPQESFSSTTVGDNTFIVNRTTKVEESDEYTHGISDLDYNKKYAYYWVKRSYIAYGGDNNQETSTYQYKVESDLGTAEQRTVIIPTDKEANSGTCSVAGRTTKAECLEAPGAGTWTASGSLGTSAYGKNTLTVANKIAGGLASATNSGSILRQLKENEGYWHVSDTFGNQASEGWWGYIRKVQDLPDDMGEYEGVDTLIKVTGDENNNFEGFWTTYSDGVWRESIQTGIKAGFKPSTMPHVLVRNTLTDFTFEPFDFDERKVGDDFSNSMPSFVGHEIEDLFFYRNRLGLISQDAVIMSEVGIYENFFRTTVTDLLASDTIDVAVDSNKVVSLKYAIPFKRNLLLFGANAQYILSGENDLRPDNVSISQSTEYQLNAKTKPRPIGSNTYFTVNKGEGTQVREYYNVPDSVDNIADDITAHVSDYIPKNAIDLEVSDKYDMIFILSAEDGAAGNIYVYNQTWEGDKKAQSAWHRWEVGSANTNILAIRVLDDDLYLICNTGADPVAVLTKISLAKVEDFATKDHRDLINDPVNTNGTCSLGDAYTTKVACEEATPTAGVWTMNTADDTITEYVSYLQLSEWGFNAGGQAKTDDKQGRLQIRKIQLQTREGSEQKIQVQVGSASSTSKGDAAFVMGEAQKTKITIKSVGSKGFCIDSVSLKGRYNSKSRTV